MITCTLKKGTELIRADDKARRVWFDEGVKFTFISKQGKLALLKHEGAGVFAVPKGFFERLFDWKIKDTEENK